MIPVTRTLQPRIDALAASTPVHPDLATTCSGDPHGTLDAARAYVRALEAWVPLEDAHAEATAALNTDFEAALQAHYGTDSHTHAALVLLTIQIDAYDHAERLYALLRGGVAWLAQGGVPGTARAMDDLIGEAARAFKNDLPPDAPQPPTPDTAVYGLATRAAALEAYAAALAAHDADVARHAEALDAWTERTEARQRDLDAALHRALLPGLPQADWDALITWARTLPTTRCTLDVLGLDPQAGHVNNDHTTAGLLRYVMRQLHDAQSALAATAGAADDG